MRAFAFSLGLVAAAATFAMAADNQFEQKSSEADLLKDVKVPEGFDATIFAAPPMANYPVFVAAATDGTLYVSSDGNGSLGRDPHRGRILRLRDVDGDGRADEVKEFVKDVDSPRGLVWDHDRLYLLHPPNISVYVDKDGDGIADEEKVLVKNIGWTFKDRPADHASNGLELGIDGWIYAAIGDFGFMEAEGTDGRKVQLRGGGVVRVRPDGTGLHIYARGTRNILEPAVSPLLDVITRDNTNDGGGWDIRLHHNTGLANHGYPSLFKNFPDELIQPLADYGGGSGCGAAWIDEPGLPIEWNNAPFTCDWGRGWVYMHRLEPNGATFKSPAPQKEFIGLTRPTDLDVDGNSRIYIASWKGATFNWAGPNVGYIVQLRPKGFTPEPMPDFEKLSPGVLAHQLSSPSARRRLEAQRALIRRKLVESRFGSLIDVAGIAPPLDATRLPLQPLPTRIAALFAFAQAGKVPLVMAERRESLPYVIRAAGEPDHVSNQGEQRIILDGLRSGDAPTRLQSAIAIGFQRMTNASVQLAGLIADSDLIVAHTAIEALKRLEAADVCWPILDSDAGGAKRAGALRVLQALHKPEVVDGLTSRLQSEKDAERRHGLFVALSRLYFTDGVWKGDSWGTRPDTSGPYYQAELWSESPRILRALNDAVGHASGAELGVLAAELNRHKIQSDSALTKVIAAADADANLIPAAVGQIYRAEQIPAGAESLLVKAVKADATPEIARSQAVMALAKGRSAEAAQGGLAGLVKLEASKNSETEAIRRQARNQFFNSPALDSQLDLLASEGAKGGDLGLLANAALLMVSERRSASPEVKELAKVAVEKAWTANKVQMLKAIALTERAAFRDRVLAGMDDSDAEVAKAAREAARALRIDGQRARRAPKIESMSVPDVIAAVVKTKGDIETGKKLFTQQTCVNCHTVSDKEAQRGPYLGNIAATYKRPELAENILVPNKTIAQGFVANHFELKNGEEHDGFVTLEAADKVTIRDTNAQEFTLPVKDIVKRQKLEKSLMPEGLVAPLTIQEFASLLDYLENLAAKPTN